MEPVPESPLLGSRAHTNDQENGELHSLQVSDTRSSLPRDVSNSRLTCHSSISRPVLLVSSTVVGMSIVALSSAMILREVVRSSAHEKGHGKGDTAEIMVAKFLVESPVAVAAFIFLVMLVGSSVIFCTWRLAHWQDAREVIAEQQEEEERRKRNLLKHLRGTQAFEMPAPDKPLPTIAGTTPTADNERQSTCAICLEPLNPGDACRLLPCNHIFHTSCTDSWLQDRHSCPTCRHDIRMPEDLPQEAQAQWQPPLDSGLPLAWRIVIFLIVICLMTGVQDRIFDAIMGTTHAQEHREAWVNSSEQNAAGSQSSGSAHRYRGGFLQG